MQALPLNATTKPKASRRKKKREEEMSKFEEKEGTEIKGCGALLQLVLLHIV